MTSAWIAEAVALYKDAKDLFEAWVRLDRDLLHVLLGPLLAVAVAKASRRPLHDPGVWLAVLGLALVNEWADLLFERWPDSELRRQYMESAKDIALTMIGPSLLLWNSGRRAERDDMIGEAADGVAMRDDDEGSTA